MASEAYEQRIDAFSYDVDQVAVTDHCLPYDLDLGRTTRQPFPLKFQEADKLSKHIILERVFPV